MVRYGLFKTRENSLKMLLMKIDKWNFNDDWKSWLSGISIDFSCSGPVYSFRGKGLPVKIGLCNGHEKDLSVYKEIYLHLPEVANFVPFNIWLQVFARILIPRSYNLDMPICITPGEEIESYCKVKKWQFNCLDNLPKEKDMWVKFYLPEVILDENYFNLLINNKIVVDLIYTTLLQYLAPEQLKKWRVCEKKKFWMESLDACRFSDTMDYYDDEKTITLFRAPHGRIIFDGEKFTDSFIKSKEEMDIWMYHFNWILLTSWEVYNFDAKNSGDDVTLHTTITTMGFYMREVEKALDAYTLPRDLILTTLNYLTDFSKLPWSPQQR